ncbi:probable glutamate receptor [Palaemon carinicauda]|uniref:probable glutamate receptor n=1 Tax=Palaemon carinicauda TaxID=392227 RepID=UPI0035B5CF3E
MDYTVDSKEEASTVTPKDSMDFRMLTAFAGVLNFTYEIRAPWDMQWGNPLGNGNWSGLVGTLQHEKADFSTVMAPNSGRLAVLSHSRAYIADTLVVTSLKPRPLTQYLLVVRPFEVEVWLSLLITIIVWGLTLWLLQKALSRMLGERSMDPISAIFYGLGLLLEDPPSESPTHVTTQVNINIIIYQPPHLNHCSAIAESL